MNDATDKTLPRIGNLPTMNGGVIGHVLDTFFGEGQQEQLKRASDEAAAEAKRLATKAERRSDFRARCNMTQLATVTVALIVLAFFACVIMGRIAWLVLVW